MFGKFLYSFLNEDTFKKTKAERDNLVNNLCYELNDMTSSKELKNKDPLLVALAAGYTVRLKKLITDLESDFDKLTPRRPYNEREDYWHERIENIREECHKEYLKYKTSKGEGDPSCQLLAIIISELEKLNSYADVQEPGGKIELKENGWKVLMPVYPDVKYPKSEPKEEQKSSEPAPDFERDKEQKYRH